MDILKDLFRIKKFREDKAELELLIAKKALANAEICLKEAKKNKSKFEHDCLLEERSMFDDLCTRLVFLKDLDAVIQKIELMKEEKKQFQKKIDELDEARNIALENSQIKNISYCEAVRNREKFSALINANFEEQMKEIQRIEDAEMEESSSSQYLHEKREYSGVFF